MDIASTNLRNPSARAINMHISSNDKRCFVLLRKTIKDTEQYTNRIDMITTYNNSKYIFCANCGCIGHVYRNCNHPVTSYGIICYRINYDPITNSLFPQYLMVQRKDSMSYVEFIRGKYDVCNRGYLSKLFANMTESEHEKLRLCDFDTLWKDLWQVPDCKNFVKEYNEAKAKFDMLRKGFKMLVNDTNAVIHFDLVKLLNSIVSVYKDTEWGFPKGRRNINEDDVQCALREFTEETGYSKNHVYMLNSVKAFEEVFSGTNKVRYKHIYYLAQFKDDVPKDQLSPVIAHEIRDVAWYNYHDAQKRIREYNMERKELFRRVNQVVLKNMYLYNKLHAEQQPCTTRVTVQQSKTAHRQNR